MIQVQGEKRKARTGLVGPEGETTKTQARGAFLLGAELVTIGGFLLFTASHCQEVDAVGLWVGDFAEWELVDARVVACEEEEGESRETEGPGAWWHTNLQIETRNGRMLLGSCLEPETWGGGCGGD